MPDAQLGDVLRAYRTRLPSDWNDSLNRLFGEQIESPLLSLDPILRELVSEHSYATDD